MKTVFDEAFRPYGRVLDLDTKEFCEVMKGREATAEGTVAYEPSVAELEALPLFSELQSVVYGALPIEFGHCSGFNTKLNALEYHRSSEVDIAATDLVLMLGRQQDINYETLTYDTAKVESFLVPAGTAVELYATTLHYAPARADGEFRCGVVLPLATNEPRLVDTKAKGEASLLFAKNKWLLAHEESGLASVGAIYGLKGENISL